MLFLRFNGQKIGIHELANTKAINFPISETPTELRGHLWAVLLGFDPGTPFYSLMLFWN
jgi:hypothetical protein